MIQKGGRLFKKPPALFYDADGPAEKLSAGPPA